MELQWKNKDKSLFIDYDNNFTVHWVPKNCDLITESRNFLSFDNLNIYLPARSILNSLILGDNIFVLNTLIYSFKNFKNKEKVKFVYIDPPYNTFNPELRYKDNLQHEEWLTFMRDRLERVKEILRKDGVICIQIDDREFARLYLLMIELFGEKNLKTIIVKMSESSGLKMQSVKNGGIPKLKEYLLLAKMDGIQGFHFKSVPKKSWDPEYNLFIKNFSEEDKKIIKFIQEKNTITHEDLLKLDYICKKFELVTINKVLEEENIKEEDKLKFFKENSWRICRTASSNSIFKLTEEKKSILSESQQVFTVLSKKGILYFVKSDYTPKARKPRVQILFADEHLSTPLGDLWTDIKTTGLEFEGEIDFKNGKKPEKLMKRLIEGITDEGDLVIDLFGGSGTTASVALELKRKFISTEVNNEIFLIARKRLQNKIRNLKNTANESVPEVNYLKISDSTFNKENILKKL